MPNSNCSKSTLVSTCRDCGGPAPARFGGPNETTAAYYCDACLQDCLIAALKAMLFAPATRNERRLNDDALAAIAKAEGAR